MHLSGKNRSLALIAALLLCPFSITRGADALLLGRAALSDRQPAEAERHLVGYLAANQARPEACPEALLLLLRAVSDQGRPADVLSLLETNADIASNAPPAQIAYWKARSLLELGRSSQALAIATNQLPAAQETATASREGDPRSGHDKRFTDYVLLLRIQARALADTPGQEVEAAKVFKTVDEALSPDFSPSMKAANLYEWARLAFASGDKKSSGELLGRLHDLSPSLTNTPSLPLEGGLLLQASLLIDARTPLLAIPLLQSLMTNETATLPTRAEALLSLATLSVEEERAPFPSASGRVLPPPASYTSTLESFTREMPSERAWDINRQYGRLLLSATSSIPTGASILSKTIREHPSALSSPLDRLAIADAWLSISSNTLAASEYQSYLEAYQESPAMAMEARRGQATALMRIGDYEEAATLFLKVGDSTSSADLRAECLLLAAQSLRSGKKYERAAGLFLKAAEIPSTTNGQEWISSVYFDAADCQERAADLKAARTLFLMVSENGVPLALADQALYRAAMISDRLGDRRGGIAAYSALIQRTTDDHLKNEARLGRGRDYYDSFQFSEAFQDFSDVSSAYPEIASEAAFYSLFCLYGLNRDKEAVRAAEQFIKDRPGSAHLPAIVLWLAQYHYNRHDYGQAQRIFTEYSRKWPLSSDTAKALLWGATAAFERTEYQQSIDLLALMLRAHPTSPFAGEARFLQAKALCNLARYEEAILALDDVINRYPAADFVIDAWILLGDARFSSASSEKARKRYDEAREAYEAARARCTTVKTDTGVIPSDEDFARFIESAYKIGRCLEKNDTLTEARRYYYDNVITPYQEAIQQGTFPDSRAATWFARAILQTADILEGEGNLDGAISVLNHLSELDLPERGQALRMLKRLKKASLL